MIHKGFGSLFSLISVAILAGCASAPEHLYTLAGRTPTALEKPRASRVIILGPISIPELIDRPQIVVLQDSYRVEIVEQQRWASPLKESLTRVLAAELNQRVVDAQFVESFSAVKTVSVGRLTVDFSAVELRRPAVARMVAHWAYRDSKDKEKPVEGDSISSAEGRSPDYMGLVDALRHAVDLVAEDIAHSLNSGIPSAHN